jgi:DNA repair protein RadC
MTKRDSTAAGLRLHTVKGQLTLSIPVNERFIIDSAKRLVKQQFDRLSGPLCQPNTLRDFLLVNMASEQREVFKVFYLDNQLQAIAVETLLTGTINQAMIYTREVIKAALAHNAVSIIVAHNHPSGCPHPSQHDHDLTQELRSALALVEITLIDHWLIAGSEIVSVMEQRTR